MQTRKQWSVWFTLALILSVRIGLAEESKVPKRGLNIGNDVPISGMRCVVGEPHDRNTCLAGKYRKHRTFSVYAQSLDEPNLNLLMVRLNSLLENNQELRGYLLVLKGDQFDDELKGNIRDWAKEQSVTQCDIAINNGDSLKSFEIPDDSGVVLVYSDSQEVKFRHDFKAGAIDEAAIDELQEKLKELAR